MRTLLLTAALTLATGCATGGSIKEMRVETDRSAEDAQEHIDGMRQGRNVVPPSGVKVISEGHYMPIREVSQSRKPAETPISCSIDYNPVQAATLQEIGQAISEHCKVSVRITPDALAAVGRLGAGQGGSGSGGVPTGPTPGAPMSLPSLPALPGTAGGASEMIMFPSSAQSDRVTITWSGPISGLLDAVTARLGLSWRHKDGVVSIFHVDTRFFRINSIPTTSSMTSSVISGAQTSAGVSGNSDTGVQGTAGSVQTTNVESRTDFMKDLEDAVKSMLTPNVGRMALSRSSGGLTVTDTQETLDRVATYIEGLNEFATKQVLLNVKVLSVTLSDGNQYGINWDAVYQNIAGRYGLKLSSALSASADAIRGSVSILENTNSRFAGSDVIVTALAKEGRVSVITQPSVTTLNLEPVPVQVARQVSYLERVELGQTAQVGSTTSLKPGSVTTGFNMMLLPHILDDSETVLLQYSMNLSNLDNLRTVSSGGSTIEIPEIDNRIFNQKIKLKSNETLVISGFEQTKSDTRRNGVGSAGFWGLGGGAKGDKRRDVIVVLITPVVMG